MLKKIRNALKVSIRLRDLLIWFVCSFTAVCAIFIIVYKRNLDGYLLAEMLGYAVVFVLLMAGTKSYSHFIDVYQGSHRHRFRV